MLIVERLLKWILFRHLFLNVLFEFRGQGPLALLRQLMMFVIPEKRLILIDRFNFHILVLTQTR